MDAAACFFINSCLLAYVPQKIAAFKGRKLMRLMNYDSIELRKGYHQVTFFVISNSD
jgi:hypothetical protein